MRLEVQVVVDVNKGAKRMYDLMNRPRGEGIMAETNTITKPAPIIEGALTSF